MVWDFTRDHTHAFTCDAPGTVRCTLRGVVVSGFLNEEDGFEQDTSGNRVFVRRTVLRLLTQDLPAGSTRGDPITVDGTAYVLREFALEDDGLITRLILARG